MNILGISAFYHDSAAALIRDGEIIAAAQEERFTRKKHDAGFPIEAINFCLKKAKNRLEDIDYIVFYDKPFLKFERLLETYLSFAPKGFKSFCTAMPIWLKDKLFQRNIIRKQLKAYLPNFPWEERLLFSEHHLSHAASVFFPSPFSDALVLTIDGVGEWATTSAMLGHNNQLDILKEIHFPHSLGLLYSAFTYYLGFKVNSGEYKIMGLAPYGQPKYKQIILNHLIDVKDDGSFRLNMKYFNYCVGLTMVNQQFADLFGVPIRRSEDELKQAHMDLAASVQAVTEEVMLKLCAALASETGAKNLCLAGGVALNCVANGKILQAKIFDDIWIQPAAGDAGGALGAALVAYYLHLQKPRQIKNDGQDTMRGSYLGPSFSEQEIEEALKSIGAQYQKHSDETIIQLTAQDLAEGKAIGWMQGAMEYGPRALGNRSILADPRSVTMQSTLNLKVKFRESFRPFAPAVLREEVQNWFALNQDSPYMLLVADVADSKKIPQAQQTDQLFGIERLQIQRSIIPAVTHVDYSARVQTVHQQTNPKFHALIDQFNRLTQCPVLVNTSFNVRGEPIVCTPADAFRCFMGTKIERLVIGNCYLKKEDQPSHLQMDYKDQFELD